MQFSPVFRHFITLRSKVTISRSAIIKTNVWLDANKVSAHEVYRSDNNDENGRSTGLKILVTDTGWWALSF
jgi:hypothetical protein